MAVRGGRIVAGRRGDSRLDAPPRHDRLAGRHHHRFSRTRRTHVDPLGRPPFHHRGLVRRDRRALPPRPPPTVPLHRPLPHYRPAPPPPRPPPPCPPRT